MKKIIILLFLFLMFRINSEETNKNIFIKIKSISVGQQSGQIGWEMEIAGGGGGADNFLITNDNRIILQDRINYRFNIYDMDMNYITTVTEKDIVELCYAYKINITSDDDIIGVTENGFKKMDESGNTIFFINKNKLPVKVYRYDYYFPVDDEIFIYDDNDSLGVITRDGIIGTKEEAIKVINKLNNQFKEDNESDTPVVLHDKINNIKLRYDYPVIKDEVYTISFQLFKDFIDEIRSHYENKNLHKNQVIKENDFYKYNIGLIGYDEIHNSYWYAIEKNSINGKRKYIIIVYSKYGVLLASFYFGLYSNMRFNNELYPTSGAEVAIAPNGDVYFMVGNEKEYTFYKVKRAW